MTKQLATNLYKANLFRAARAVDLGRLDFAIKHIAESIAECERDGATYGAVYNAAKNMLPVVIKAEATRANARSNASEDAAARFSLIAA